MSSTESGGKQEFKGEENKFQHLEQSCFASLRPSLQPVPILWLSPTAVHESLCLRILPEIPLKYLDPQIRNNGLEGTV